MNNIPQIKLGIVAVSRDCFPESLSVDRRKALVSAYEKKYGAENIDECPVPPDVGEEEYIANLTAQKAIFEYYR